MVKTVKKSNLNKNLIKGVNTPLSYQKVKKFICKDFITENIKKRTYYKTFKLR